MSTTVSVIERSVEKTNVWINEVAAALDTDDRQYAYRALRAVMHALRDRLPVDEAAQLAAQMPDMVRGIYYENWVPSRTPASYHDLDAFLSRVAGEAQLAGDTEASFACTAVAAVMRNHISAGELQDVVAALPQQIGALLNE